jgi:hypothetical protein
MLEKSLKKILNSIERSEDKISRLHKINYGGIFDKDIEIEKDKIERQLRIAEILSKTEA